MGVEVETPEEDEDEVSQGPQVTQIVAPLLHPPPQPSIPRIAPSATPILVPIVLTTQGTTTAKPNYHNASIIAGTSSAVAVATTSLGGGGTSVLIKKGEEEKPLSSAWETALSATAMNKQRKPPVRRGKVVQDRPARALFYFTLKNPIRKMCIDVVEWK